MTLGETLAGNDRKTSAIMLVPAVVIALLVVGLLPDGIDRVMRMLRLDQTLSLAWQSGIVTIALFGVLIAVAVLWGMLAKQVVLASGRSPLKSAGVGVAMGIAGVLVATGYVALAGSLHWTITYNKPHILLLLAGSCLTLFQCAGEEIYFRGWVQPMLARGWGVWPGLVVTSLLFAALHVFAGVRAPLSLLNVFLAGGLFGLLAVRTGGLMAPVAAHFAWDWMESIGLGLYPNPGVDVWTSLWNLDMVGSPLWGGSTEGLNGSLAETFVLVALAVPFAWGLIVPQKAAVAA